MNQKDLREIRRRFRPEHNSVTKVYGCYVNANKEIISRVEESVGLMTQEEQEKYFSLLKKALSGGLGKNLLNVSFATRDVMESEEHKLLAELRKSELKDDALREALYEKLIESLDFDDNYLILLCFDSYDVPHYGKDESSDDSGEVYRYLLCCVCPVKSGKLELGYVPEEKRFHSALAGQVVGAPTLGFLYPSFDERRTNIYNALFYSRDTGESHEKLIDAVFRSVVPLPAKRQRDLFDSALAESMGQELSFDLMRAVNEQLSERLELHKESKDPDPLSLSVNELGDILENSGAEPEQAERFCQRCEENFGPDAELLPSNLSDPKRMSIQCAEVKISVDPKFSYLIEAREIDGKKYLLISADQGVELNGMQVKI